jgi:putative oxidoreductase
VFAHWSSYAALPLRIVLGVVFVVHGAQKLFGLFGGDGVARTAAIIASYGFEPGTLWAVVFGLVQLVGGVALLLGLLARWTALALVLERLVVMSLVNIPAGFTAVAGGVEFSLVMIGALLALACTGAQRYALDEQVPVLAEWSPPGEIKKAA